MSSLRRFVAALSGALVLQLSLLASGTLCAIRGTGAMNGMSAGHATHTRHSAYAAGRESSVRSPAQTDRSGSTPAGCDASTTTEGCRLPWAPGQCASMTTCTVTASPSVAAAPQLSVAGGLGANLPEPRSIHSGPTSAPEIPPPRA
jgi:hypothetical protein